MEESDNQSKKMCIFCHAQVAISAKICPFCRAQFDQLQNSPDSLAKKNDTNASPSLSEKQMLDSLYPPPYQPKMERIEEEVEEIEEKEQSVPVAKQKSILVPIFLFSLGSQLFIFSLFLLLFSEEGMLLLQWKASLWYLYSLVSLALLFAGYKLFSNLELE